ncbi:MAG: hypothetical protein Fues2KO_45910 [Fuerstiella sp.]
MNGRVLLLVMVTGLFMAAWDGDQEAMQAALARREAAQHTQIANVPQPEPLRVTTVSHSAKPASAAAVVDQPRPAEPTNAAATTATVRIVDVPLPAAIAAGSYQAVNQSGRTIRVEISEAGATSNTAQDLYTVDGNDGSRWYLVRLQQ